MTEHGIEVAQQAPLGLYADSQLLSVGNNSRLRISIQLTDFKGNIYGRWENRPSLLMLPTSANVESLLTQGHLASKSTTT